MIYGKMTLGPWEGGPDVWTVSCADCEEWDAMSGKKSIVKKEFQKSGWQLVRKVWRCPAHKIQNKKKKDC